MPCIVCARMNRRGFGLCETCRSGLQSASDVVVGGVVVSAGLVHTGPARRLIHLLKYSALTAAAAPLAAAMAERMSVATALVPIPRVRLRRWRYGIDPAAELSSALARLTGVPVVPALIPAWWHPRRAGPAGNGRGAPVFRMAAMVPEGALLIDDVLTTGCTVAAAFAAIGRPVPTLTATLAPTFRSASVEGVRVRFESPEGPDDEGAALVRRSHRRRFAPTASVRSFFA